MKRHLTSALSAAAALVLIALPAQAETIYGMTAADSVSTSPGLALVRFDSATPGTITSIGSFSGVVAGHALRSMDFRPATGELYAISTSTTVGNFAQAQLYKVNLTTAALTPVGSGLTLTGNANVRVEMDFNPVADRIRIVTSGASQTPNNFRADPNTGALVAVDTAAAYAAGDLLAGAPIALIAAAYSNNVAGATSTTLYGYDYNNDTLVTIGGVGGTPSPNGGQTFTVGTPPADLLTGNAGAGMDISGATGILYLTHDDPATFSPMSLYTVNLSTGEQTLVGNYGGGLSIVDISVPTPVPEPAAYLTMALGLAGLLAWRRRQQR